MKLKSTIAFFSLVAIGTLQADLAKEPHYYEDYLRSLESGEEHLSKNETKENTSTSSKEEKTDGNKYTYYEDYIDSTKDQYESGETKNNTSNEIIADAGSEYENALAQALATNIPQTKVDMPVLSEAFGNFLGKNLKTSGIEFNVDNLIKGLRDGLDGKPSPLTEGEYEAMMMAVQQQTFAKLSDSNLEKAEAFMNENATKAGIIEIVPGRLQYTVLAEGSGAEVATENTPLINYTGKFIDGTVFSTSEETGGAITIPLSHTIPGFQKGITGMREGEKRRLFIHPEQGYGSNAGHLPPNSLLIFDIEVVEADHDDGDDVIDDLDNSDATPADQDIDNSDVEIEEQDKMMK